LNNPAIGSTAIERSAAKAGTCLRKELAVVVQ
jgi:hypothetical protein